jgi:transcriptional regulator with XRE-family HTH domain
MPKTKSTFTPENKIFLDLLRKERKAAGVSQVELAKRLKQKQDYISKSERGDRRLDIIETLFYCRGIGVEFAEFAAKYADAVRSASAVKRSTPRRKA